MVSSDNQRASVYLVDDHPVFRLGLKQIIESDPRFTICGQAANGNDALQEIVKRNPDIVVVDVNLPGRGGLDIVRALRDQQCRAACIMMTMDADESTFNAAIDAGAHGYILKDDALELVLLGLRTVLAGTLYLSPAISSWLMRRQQRSSALRSRVNGLSQLTPTERRVLQLVGQNRTNKQIGEALFISHRTVETHRSNICHKLDLQGAHKLLQFAIEHRSEL